MSGECRCECCGVDLELQHGLPLEDADLCYPCAIELGYLQRSPSAGDEYRLFEMYKLREIKARAKRLERKMNDDAPLFILANEPSVGLLLTHGDNGELIVQIVKSNGSTHVPVATATLEPYRRLRVSDFAAGDDQTYLEVEKRLDRAIQLLSAAHMMLEAAEYRDSENAVCALDTRQQIDAFLPKDALR